MSIKLMANVMELDIQSGAKFVLLIMANFASDEGENVYPSHDTIARLTSMTRRTVVSTVKQLVDDGYVKLDGKKGNRQNVYSLNVNKISEGALARTAEVRKIFTPEDAEVCKIFTPEEVRCETISHNPLSIKELKDIKDIKDLKDLSSEIFSQQNTVYELMQVLATTCKRVLADNKGVISRYAKELKKLGYSVSDIENFAVWWYRNDWRGKRNQAPTPAQVQQLIGSSKLQTKSTLPTQEEIDRAMQEITWEDEDE